MCLTTTLCGVRMNQLRSSGKGLRSWPGELGQSDKLR
jgi:hypothetical protein